jgi:hypothetical protein
MDKITNFCSACGRKIGKGSPSWNMFIKIWANYDGDIGFANQTENQIDHSISVLLDRIEKIDAGSLENEVYQELKFRLCKDCRDRFTANPLNQPLI